MRKISEKQLLNSNRVKWIGRYYYDEKHNAVWFNFSASGFRIRFFGKNLQARFLATKSQDDINRPYLAVFHDEASNAKDARVIEITSQVSEHVLFAGEEGFHQVIVLKRNECITGSVALLELTCDGEFLENDIRSNKLRIEFYGNSVTAGNGTAAENNEQQFTTKTEDACRSFAYLSAKMLNAEYSLICVGGFPVYKSPWVDWCKIKNIIPLLNFADFNENTTMENAIIWDNQRFVPDIVVLNLAANDSHYFDRIKNEINYQSELNEFEKQYRLLIDRLFLMYPYSKVIVTWNMLKIRDDINEVLERISSDPTRAIYRLKFSSLLVGGSMPNEGHPNAKMHAHAALELASFIKEKVII